MAAKTRDVHQAVRLQGPHSLPRGTVIGILRRMNEFSASFNPFHVTLKVKSIKQILLLETQSL